MSLMRYFRRRTHVKSGAKGFRPSRFRRRLLTTLVVSMVILFASSLIAAWLIGSWVERALTSQMEQAAHDFARNSVMVFLLQDPEVTRSSAATMHAFPWVRGVEFLDRDHKPLAQKDRDEPARRPLILPPGAQGLASHQWDERNLRRLLIPVYARPQSSPLERSAPRAPRTEALGYVYLTLDRTRLVQFRIAIAAAYVLLMGISASGLLLWFRRRVKVLDTEVALMTAGLREAYSETLTASQHKSEFLATITHELRTPIASIRGFAELALQDLRFAENAGPAAQRIKSMQEIADNILKRVGDILIFAQAEAGTELTMGEVELRPFIQHIVDLFQPVLSEKGNTFTVSITGPEYVYTDESKLFHIVSNLLSNACKFTEEGAIEMTVAVGPNTLTVVIEDNGIGIKEEHLKHVFEPFYQVDMSDTRQHSGVGLGLAIAKRYCELLGGTVKVTSEAGVGSRFQVDIPAAHRPKPR